jgi:integrase
MLEVAGFCWYRCRTEPQCFAADPSSFPAHHQRVNPYISEPEAAKLLRAASGLPRYPASPLRPEVIRLALALLLTTGIRRGERLALTLGDDYRRESTLHIRETKFINHACFRSMTQSPKRRINVFLPELGESSPSLLGCSPHLERRLERRSV